MSPHILNVLVVGISDISTSILRALSYSTFYTHNHNHNHDSAKHTHHEHEQDHSHAPSYTLTLLTHPLQTPTSSPPIPSLTHRTLPSPLNESNLTALLNGQDIVISATAPADTTYQSLLIDAAIAAGVKHFIPCEFSYDTCDEVVREVFPPAKARWEVLEYLRTRNDGLEHHTEEMLDNGLGSRGRMGWTGIATGLSLEPALRSGGVLGFDTDWKSGTVYGNGTERWPCSSLGWVGAAVRGIVDQLASGKRREVGQGHYKRRAEFMTSQIEVLDCLKDIVGGDWTVEKGDLENCRREAEKRMELGFFDGAMLLKEREILFDEARGLELWEEGEKGKRTRRLEDAVKESLEGGGKVDCGCG